MNSFGKSLILTTFGESHGVGIGGVLDGFPSAFKLDLDKVRDFLDKRRPGSGALVSTRQEFDRVTFLSGLLEDGTTTGAPIAFFIGNEDPDAHAYKSLERLFRPAHADFTYFSKYKLSPQPGGGRASARETVARCVGGAIASQLLASIGIGIHSFVSELGRLSLDKPYRNKEDFLQSFGGFEAIYEHQSRCPSSFLDEKITSEIAQIRLRGDSLGGVVSTIVDGLPAGVGEPIYDKLSARLGYAMLSINASKGFEIGEGFGITSMRGSEANDAMTLGNNGEITFCSNHSGGILGGISTGQDLFFRVAFKPTPTIARNQATVTIDNREATIASKGRHDPAVVIRAVPVVEAMTALVLADFILQMRRDIPLEKTPYDSLS